MYPIIHFLNRDIGTYGLFAIAGLLVCGFVVSLLAKKRKKIPVEDVVIAILIIAAGLLIGSHILYGITQWRTIGEMLSGIGSKPIAELWNLAISAFGGSVFYGGFLGGGAALGIYLKIKKDKNIRSWFDFYGIAIPLFHTFGRIGCFFGGCCYGIESTFGFTAHGNTLIPELNDVQRFPVQLLESLCNLLLFFALLIIYKHIKSEGRMIFFYMIIYPVIRFSDEFLRGDVIRGVWGPFSTSQWVSIFVFIAGVIGMIVINRKDRKKEAAACGC